MSEEPKRKPIKVIFIDAIKEETRWLVLEEGGAYQEMFRHLTLPDRRIVDDINIVRIDNQRHYIHVDGEGLLKDPEHFILWKGYPNPLAGHAIILRVDEEGDSRDCELTLDFVDRRLKFVKLKMHGFVQVKETAELFGKPGLRITRVPVLTERREPGTGKSLDLDEIADHMGVPRGTLDWDALPQEGDDHDVPSTEQSDD